MTEVLTTILAPIFVMLILVLILERFIYSCVLAADFVMRLLTSPPPPRRPVSKK